MGPNKDPVASGGQSDAAGRDDGEPGNAKAEAEEERFIDELLARREAVPEGTELPPGATHEVYLDDRGRRHLRRVRFSAS